MRCCHNATSHACFGMFAHFATWIASAICQCTAWQRLLRFSLQTCKHCSKYAKIVNWGAQQQDAHQRRGSGPDTSRKCFGAAQVSQRHRNRGTPRPCLLTAGQNRQQCCWQYLPTTAHVCNTWFCALVHYLMFCTMHLQACRCQEAFTQRLQGMYASMLLSCGEHLAVTTYLNGTEISGVEMFINLSIANMSNCQPGLHAVALSVPSSLKWASHQVTAFTLWVMMLACWCMQPLVCMQQSTASGMHAAKHKHTEI